ncbi:hypothetical protein FNV43_RR18494 [Rhamnella rubrinervis]|uniref:Cytochrome P450 n=1 Tax=Rhamnella rubrinervis TaxID=2594499 RepID=A0A8K0E0U5_9ROSA|nr:hypothetical protein FNV43_RR18494 [Rhamnella rubrinervis]
MEDTLFYSCIFLITLLFTFKLFFSARHPYKHLPPGPPSLPIIGHLNLLKPPVHRTFSRLSQTYGPIFTLWFGSRRVVVVSSSSAVEECFTKNDIVLANRPQLLAGKHLGYTYTTISGSPYGDHWRNLRRIGAIEIFSSSRLNMFLGNRKDEVKRLLHKLSHNSLNDFAKVEMKTMLSELTFNIIMRMVAGKRYYGDEVTDEDEARQFREITKEIVAHGGAANPGDFLPVLNWIGSDSFESRLRRLAKRTDAFLQGLINEHRTRKESRNTMIDHLLSLQESQPDYYTDQIIKGFIQVLVELDEHVGQQNLVDEPDLPKLRYLQNIISETLRLNPAAPMLVPHYSSNDCQVGGYDVPRDTILLVNAWAIHRDPKMWEDPDSFKPERFEVGEGDLVHKLLPFGIGRRACPGAGLAQRVIGLTLGSLIQCFEWERVNEEQIDMTEGKGVTMPKAVPLEAMCKARPIVKKSSHSA